MASSIAFITPRLPIATPEHIHLALSAAYRHLRALSEDSGSTKGALTCEDLKRFKLAIPPKPEQEALLAYIRSEIHSLTDAIARHGREIALLCEYRTRLVADVVTGKLDVRAAAATLPDQAAPEVAGDEGDLSDEGDVPDEEDVA